MKKYKVTNKCQLILKLLISFFVIFGIIFINIRHAQDIDTKFIVKPTVKGKTKVNGAFVVVLRNDELESWLKSMQHLEDKFNINYNYPYVFLNYENFTKSFIDSITTKTAAKLEFGVIPKAHWQVPEWIDTERAAEERVHSPPYSYARSEYYRNLFRYHSGYFFRHPLLKNYDYYWRVDPNAEFTCDIVPDPFRYIHENQLKFGFNLAPREDSRTLRTLWPSVKEYLNTNKHYKAQPSDNSLQLVSNDYGKTYNKCAFWSNFEMGALSVWRSAQYLDYFNFLDKKGGFFYERWSDSAVHSIYLSLFLHRDEIHFFENIGYNYDGVSHCPRDPWLRTKCKCDPSQNGMITYSEPYSCVPLFRRIFQQTELFSFSNFELSHNYVNGIGDNGVP